MKLALEVRGLRKEYPGFTLKDVSFSVEAGSITGFIGRNGAGKSTTLKALLHLVHPTAGEVRFFGLPLAGHELEIRRRVGYAAGGVSWYPRRRLGEIAGVVAPFYPNWDWGAYRRYLDRFGLEEGKRPVELSEGMKLKFHLALALSHRAELLLLDEPTSGLDPVSRGELLELLLELAEEGTAIFFSTHITSDLEKCAGSVAYIRRGELLAACPLEEFRERYRLAALPGPPPAGEGRFLGTCRTREGYTALIRREEAGAFPPEQLSVPGLEDLMAHLEKGGDHA